MRSIANKGGARATYQRAARLIVDDVGHEPRTVRLSGTLGEHIDAEI